MSIGAMLKLSSVRSFLRPCTLLDDAAQRLPALQAGSSVSGLMPALVQILSAVGFRCPDVRQRNHNALSFRNIHA
jgi:hypothetical protein